MTLLPLFSWTCRLELRSRLFNDNGLMPQLRQTLSQAGAGSYDSYIYTWLDARSSKSIIYTMAIPCTSDGLEISALVTCFFQVCSRAHELRKALVIDDTRLTLARAGCLDDISHLFILMPEIRMYASQYQVATATQQIPAKISSPHHC